MENKKLTFEPVLDMVVLEREKAAESLGGFDLPTSAQDRPLRGVVVALGNKLSEKTVVKLGRTMLYKKYGGTEVNIEGIDYVVIKESDIILGL